MLAWIRPELIWADRVDGVLVATGLSARAQAFFSRATIDAVSLPIFDRFYFAPEAHDTDVDDRALTFALAIMIAEWAMGRFPFKRKWYDFVHEGRHLSLKPMLKPLAALLSRGMRPPRRDERPPLVRFLAELERL